MYYCIKVLTLGSLIDLVVVEVGESSQGWVAEGHL